MEVTEEAIARIVRAALVEIAPPAAPVTMQKLADDYLKLYAKKKSSFRKDCGYIENYILPAFGNRAVSEITPRQVEEAFGYWSERYPVAANRALEVLRVMFKLAIRWEYRRGQNPAAEIQKNQERPRERYLTAEELPRLARALSLEPAKVQAAFRIYLYTALRKEELAGARWSEVNWSEKYLHIPGDRTKNRRAHPCALSDQAIELLASIPREGEFIFPGMFVNTRLDMDKAWRRIRERADLKDVTIHDFRRTCGTHLRNGGVALQDIADVCNHLDPKSTLRYAPLHQDKMRSILNQASAAIDAMLDISIPLVQ